MKRAWMDRFIDGIEWIAAGFIGIVALDIFLSVLLRNTLNYAIPDSFDIGRMLLGILIFWGIAATSYRGTHITVDLVWASVGRKFLTADDAKAFGLVDKVIDTRNSHIVTMDLGVPVWPFFLVSWIGDVSAVLLIAIRTYRLIFHPEEMHDPAVKGTE